jgi:hypothetical protein
MPRKTIKCRMDSIAAMHTPEDNRRPGELYCRQHSTGQPVLCTAPGAVRADWAWRTLYRRCPLRTICPRTRSAHNTVRSAAEAEETKRADGPAGTGPSPWTVPSRRDFALPLVGGTASAVKASRTLHALGF